MGVSTDNRLLLAQPCLKTSVAKQRFLGEKQTAVVQVWTGTQEGYSSQHDIITVYKIHYKK